jgi:hypothetical protein
MDAMETLAHEMRAAKWNFGLINSSNLARFLLYFEDVSRLRSVYRLRQNE